MNRIFNFQFSIFKKLSFFLKRPKVIIVAGARAKETAKEAIFHILRSQFRIGKELLVFETDFKDMEELKFMVKKSRLVVLVVSHLGEYHPEREFFAGNVAQISEIEKLAGVLPPHAYLVLNFDDETVRELRSKTLAHLLTFGFGVRADIRASDIILTQTPDPGTNFKINYQGNVIPVWLERLFGKEQIYAALAAAAVGEILGLNLVKISEGLKSYQGLPGRLRMIRGIKHSWILDDSAFASPFSMAEALEILRKIEVPAPARKIAVLGDILGIDQYSLEAHEAIGERVAKSADVLFTFGPRAKFLARAAQAKGMALEKIFQYDRVEEGKIPLQNEIKEGDLILVDGSQEMKMTEIIEEIKEV